MELPRLSSRPNPKLLHKRLHKRLHKQLHKTPSQTTPQTTPQTTTPQTTPHTKLFNKRLHKLLPKPLLRKLLLKLLSTPQTTPQTTPRVSTYDAASGTFGQAVASRFFHSHGLPCTEPASNSAPAVTRKSKRMESTTTKTLLEMLGRVMDDSVAEVAGPDRQKEV